MSPTETMDPRPGADAMRELRTQMLVTPPFEFGIQPTEDYPRVYGVLMDWPLGENTATVVSLCDGNASLYTTSTFGVIGGSGHETVRNRARAFVRAAAEHFDDAAPTSDFAYPGSDRVHFYLLTFDGVKRIDADLDALVNGAHKHTGLFAQGQAVLTELRLVAEKDSAEDLPSGQHRQESSDESGYVNCLLTAMSQGIGRSIELRASRPVPNLVALAVGNDDLQQWLETQQFPYESLDSKQVIRTLRKNAKISGLPFIERSAATPILHALEGGRAVAHLFEICIGPFDRSARIELASDDDPRVVALQRDVDSRNAG